MEIETDKLRIHPLNEKLFEYLQGKDYEQLKHDIAQNGIQTSLHINEKNIILAGHQRHKIATELGLKTVPCEIKKFKDDFEENQYIITDNLHRRHLTPEQKAILLSELDKNVEKRQGAHLKEYPRDEKGYITKPITANMADIGHTSAAETAKLANTSVRSVERARQFVKIMEEKPELRGLKITQVLRKDRMEKQKEVIRKLAPIEGKFAVVVIDPPWQFDKEFDPDGQRGATGYPTMTLEEIKKIKIPALDNCVLWLWVPNQFLRHSFEIVEGWGFEPKNILTWVKDRYGVGRFLRNQTEHCLLAFKNKPFFDGTKDSTVIHAKRAKHSTKPEEFYALVERTCEGRKLDYFARKKREGWDVYGDEVKE